MARFSTNDTRRFLASSLLLKSSLALLLLGSGFAVEGAGRDAADIASLSLDELMQVEVTTPGKVPEKIRDTPTSLYLVGRDEIETFGYTNLSEVLENVPGFYGIDNYVGLGSSFGVRGFWNGRSQNSSLAILVNGIPQQRPDLFSNPLESINVPVEAIDRIEVSRGPNSVIYGNGASFGAINIITDASFADDQLTVLYGSDETRRAALRFSRFGDESHIVVNASLYQSNGYDHDLLELASDSRQALLPGFGVEPGNTSLAGRLEEESFYLQLTGKLRRITFDFSLNEAEVETFSGFPSVEGGNPRDSTSARFTLGYVAETTGPFGFSSKLSYHDFKSEQRYDALFPGFEGVNSNEFTSWEMESLLTYDNGDGFRFLGGVNYQRMEHFQEFTAVPLLGLVDEFVTIPNRDIYSIFGQATYRLSDRWQLVGGARYERLPVFLRTFFSPTQSIPVFRGPLESVTPRLSLIYQPAENQVWKFMAGDATQIPSFVSIFTTTEKTRTVEVNHMWSAETVSVSTSVFRNSLRDLLIRKLVVDLDTGLVDFERQAGGEVETFGMEVLVTNTFGDAIRTELGITWQDTDAKIHPQGRPSYSPEFLAHGKVSYHRDDFSLGTTLRFVGAMDSFYDLESEGSPLISDGYFGQRVDSYLSVDLTARWDNIGEAGFISLHLHNVFDEEIRYPNNPVNGLLLDRGNLGHDRGLSLKAGWRF